MKKWMQCVLSAGIIAGFLLGTSRGYLALLEDGRASPLQVFPCPVSSLPPADQAALSTGIPVPDAESFSRLLEDFLS